MVGWFYIKEEVAAPIRMLETDGLSGMMTIELAARFVPNLTMLRGKTVVEFRHWQERRRVRCLGAERVGGALMIEAVEVGPANLSQSGFQTQGSPEDWLTIGGRAFCQVTGLRASDQPDGHCLFNVALNDWRDLRIGENAPLAGIGITLGAGPEIDGSITPLLHAARDLPPAVVTPSVEIVRLRERTRLLINPFATDWGDATTLVVASIEETAPLKRLAQRDAVGA